MIWDWKRIERRFNADDRMREVGRREWVEKSKRGKDKGGMITMNENCIG